MNNETKAPEPAEPSVSLEERPDLPEDECSICHTLMSIELGLERTKYCHLCAQDRVVALEAEQAALRAKPEQEVVMTMDEAVALARFEERTEEEIAAMVTLGKQPKMADDPIAGNVRRRLIDTALRCAERHGRATPDIDDLYNAAITLLVAAKPEPQQDPESNASAALAELSAPDGLTPYLLTNIRRNWKDKKIQHFVKRLLPKPQHEGASRDRLVDAINWACGCGGEFRAREDGDGAFYWRAELIARAGLRYDGNKYGLAARATPSKTAGGE